MTKKTLQYVAKVVLALWFNTAVFYGIYNWWIMPNFTTLPPINFPTCLGLILLVRTAAIPTKIPDE